MWHNSVSCHMVWPTYVLLHLTSWSFDKRFETIGQEWNQQCAMIYSCMWVSKWLSLSLSLYLSVYRYLWAELLCDARNFPFRIFFFTASSKFDFRLLHASSKHQSIILTQYAYWIEPKKMRNIDCAKNAYKIGSLR